MEAIILGVQGLLSPPLAPGGSVTGADDSSNLRTALRDLSTTSRVVLLDAGPPDVLENWAQTTGVADLAAFRLWSGRLGGQAKPPSRLPFRFVSRRLDLRLSNSLYVGCETGMLEAAQRSGCQTWDTRHPAQSTIPPEVIGLVEWLRPILPAPAAHDD